MGKTAKEVSEMQNAELITREEAENIEIIQRMEDEVLDRLSVVDKELNEHYDYDQQIIKIKINQSTVIAHAAGMTASICEMGARIKAIKDMEDHGMFLAALENTGVTQQRASEAMRIYDEIGNANALSDLMSAGPKKLLEVTRLPDDIKQEVLETGELDGKTLKSYSVRDLRERAKELRAENDKLQKKLEKAEGELDKGRADFDELETELAMVKGRRKPTDKEVVGIITQGFEDFAKIDMSLLTLPVEDLGEDVLLKVKMLLEHIEATVILLRADISERCELYDKLQLVPPMIEQEQAAHTKSTIKKMRMTADGQ